MERLAFDTGREDFDIIRHTDGSLTIEAITEYGDSESGWGAGHVILNLEPEKVAALRRFLDAP